jgi:hypothetical protein
MVKTHVRSPVGWRSEFGTTTTVLTDDTLALLELQSQLSPERCETFSTVYSLTAQSCSNLPGRCNQLVRFCDRKRFA